MPSPKPDLPNSSPTIQGLTDESKIGDASIITEASADVSSFSLERLDDADFDTFQSKEDQNDCGKEESKQTDDGDEKTDRNPTGDNDDDDDGDTNKDEDEAASWPTSPHACEKPPFSEDISSIPHQSASFTLNAADLSSFLEIPDEAELETQPPEPRKVAFLLPSETDRHAFADPVATGSGVSSLGTSNEVFSALCGTFAKVEKSLNEFQEEVDLVRELRTKLTPEMTFYDEMVSKKQYKELRQTLVIMEQQSNAAEEALKMLIMQLEQSRVREMSAEKELDRTRERVRTVKDMAKSKGKDQWKWMGESMKTLYLLLIILFFEFLILGVAELGMSFFMYLYVLSHRWHG